MLSRTLFVFALLSAACIVASAVKIDIPECFYKDQKAWCLSKTKTGNCVYAYGRVYCRHPSTRCYNRNGKWIYSPKGIPVFSMDNCVIKDHVKYCNGYPVYDHLAVTSLKSGLEYCYLTGLKKRVCDKSEHADLSYKADPLSYCAKSKKNKYFKCRQFGNCRNYNGKCVCKNETYSSLRAKCHSAGRSCSMSDLKCTCLIGKYHRSCFHEGKKCVNYKGKCYCPKTNEKEKCGEHCIHIKRSGKCLCKKGRSKGCEMYGKDCYRSKGRCYCSKQMKIIGNRNGGGKKDCSRFEIQGRVCHAVKGECICKPAGPTASPSPTPIQSAAAQPATIF